MKSNMKRKWFIVLCFIIVLSIILIGCSNEGNVPPSNYTLYTVSGTIMDTDGNPMSNATLSFSGGFGTATTNVNGSWQKDSLKGNVTITPAKESWIFYPENYQVSGTEDNINFSANPEVTEELAQQFNQTANEVNNILENNYDPENKEESLAAAAEEVSSLPEVTEVESSDTSLIIKHKHGKREIWSSPPIPAKPVWAADLSQNVTELINESGNVSLPNNNDVVLPGNQKVLVIYAMDADPGFDEHDVPIEEAVFLLECIYGEENVDYKTDGEADVELFKKVDEYGVVVIVSHGGAFGEYSNRDGTNIMTGEEVESRYQYQRSCGIIPVNVDWGRRWLWWEQTKSFWGVTDQFFDEYGDSFADSNTLFLADTCSALKNNSLLKVLDNKGAYALIGWDGSQGIGAWSNLKLLYLMARGDRSLEEAFSSLPVDLKTWEESELKFKPEDHGNIYLTDDSSLPDDSPEIIVESPDNNSTLNHRTVTVTGYINNYNQDTHAIISYNEDSFTLQLNDDGTFSQDISLPTGENKILLNVFNENGADVLELHLNIDVPDIDLWTELSWNTDHSDIDFHLVPKGEVLYTDEDCYWNNMSTSWGGELDVDDVEGYGPEHITAENIDTGIYELYVHYYDTDGVTDYTNVRVTIETKADVKTIENNKFKNDGDLWKVAKIIFDSGDIIIIDEFPSEELSTTGVTTMSEESVGKKK